MKNPRRITMKELKNETIFPRQSNVVTIQCSGTRRIEQIHEYPGDGDELINAPVSPKHRRRINELTTPVGRRRHRHRKVDRRLPQKGDQILRRAERPLRLKPLRIFRGRHLLQERRSLQLRRFRSMAESQSPRSPPRMGDER